MVGYSLREFSALVVAGTLSFEKGLQLVYARVMDKQACCENVLGSMVAIINLPYESLRFKIESVVVSVDYNSSDQVVISCEEDGCKRLKNASAKCALQLPVGFVYNFSLMKSVCVEFAVAIEKSEFHTFGCPIFRDIDAKRYTDKANLLEQFTSAVL